MSAIASSQPLRTMDTPVNIERLDRFFQIEKALMLIQAAKLPELESWMLKQRMGYNMFEDMRHADALRRRRQELPGGKRDAGAIDAHLWKVIESCLHISGDAVFCSAVYFGFKTQLVEAYRQHLARTTSVSDLPSRQVIEQIIAEHERQIAWIEGAVALMPATPQQRKEAQEVIETLQKRIEAAGGIDGMGTRNASALEKQPRYELARDARREPRQKVTLELVVPDELNLGIDRRVLVQFMSYFREMAAAETVAGILWDAPRNMPWEFFADTARHSWDEIRHCQAGQQRLEKLGLNIWDVPVQTGNYNIRARMPMLERYAYITQIEEKGSFPGKHENEKRFRAAGDSVSADMVAYDVADETLHVKLGVKWIPELLKVLGDSRDMDALVRDATVLRERVHQELSNQQPAVRGLDGSGASGY